MSGCLDSVIGKSGRLNAGTLPQTLHISHLGEIETFDPAKVRSRESFPIVLARFEVSYQYDLEKAKPTLIPSLASDFPKISADGLVVTLPLRADARFRGRTERSPRLTSSTL